MYVSDEEVLHKLLQENGYSDITESEYSSESEINAKISSSGEQSVSTDEEEDISDSSSMQHGIWAKSGAEQPHFSFTAKPSINVDLDDPSDPVEYFELLHTPQIP
jgi:hypothetical protein